MSPADEDKICGVERDVLEQYLTLVKEKYPEVDKANYFLESNLGASGINVGITNQRDALSHLVTILARPDMTRDEKKAQIGNAEEHLRRALLETYETAVSLTLRQLLLLIERYKDHVLTLPPSHAISSAPDVVRINVVLKRVKELRQKGRSAKARNTWDAEWEAGVDCFVTAFNDLKELEQTLDGHVVNATQLRGTIESSAARRHDWFIRAGFMITGVALTILYEQWDRISCFALSVFGRGCGPN